MLHLTVPLTIRLVVVCKHDVITSCQFRIPLTIATYPGCSLVTPNDRVHYGGALCVRIGVRMNEYIVQCHSALLKKLEAPP